MFSCERGQVMAGHRVRGALPPHPSSQAGREKAEHDRFNAAHTGVHGLQHPCQIADIHGFLTGLACESADAAVYGPASGNMATVGDGSVAAYQRTQRRQTGFASSDLLAEACGGRRISLLRNPVDRAAARERLSRPSAKSWHRLLRPWRSALSRCRQAANVRSVTVAPSVAGMFAAGVEQVPGARRTERRPHRDPAAPFMGATRKGGIVQLPHKQHWQPIQQVKCWSLHLC